MIFPSSTILAKPSRMRDSSSRKTMKLSSRFHRSCWERPRKKICGRHVIYPGTIPGIPQIGLRFNQFFQYTSGNANNYYQVCRNAGRTALSPTIPRTDFEAGYFSIFMAGNFGSDIAFWVDDDLSVSGLNANGALGDGYLRFVNIGRFLKLRTDALTLKAGQFELDLPFTQARSINISPYDIYTEAKSDRAPPVRT